MTTISAALLLFLILDPLGNIPVVLSLLKPLDAKRNTLAVARASWDASGLKGIKDIFVAICEDAVAIALACFVVSR